MSPLKQVTIKTRRGVLIAALACVLMLPAGTWLASLQVNDNCARIHRIVVVGAQIIDPEALYQRAYQRHLISRAQYQADLSRARQYRPLTRDSLKLWRSADCRQ